jgi:hypothetical protein
MSSKKTRSKKRTTTLPYVKRHGAGFRGWCMENGRQRRGPTFPTEEQAHRWAVDMRENAERHALGQLTLGDNYWPDHHRHPTLHSIFTTHSIHRDYKPRSPYYEDTRHPPP